MKLNASDRARRVVALFYLHNCSFFCHLKVSSYTESVNILFILEILDATL